VALGERTAEAIKLAVGSAFPSPDDMIAEIKGRDLVSGLPKTIHVTSEEVRKAIEEPVNAIVDAVRDTLDRCPPELAADVMDKGIVLTGGGALLRDIDKLLTEETGLPVVVADDPLTCVARGGGRILELMDELGPGHFGLE
jgi:rod shape-determining protein MreB